MNSKCEFCSMGELLAYARWSSYTYETSKRQRTPFLVSSVFLVTRRRTCGERGEATVNGGQVGEFAMRGDVCGSRAAYVRGWLSSPHDARYHLRWYANSIALGVGLKR